MRSAIFWDITQHTVVVSYWHFGTTSLEMGPIDCSKTSLRNYYSMLHKNPKQHTSQITLAKNLDMHISVTNKILVCFKVTLHHSGLKKCSHLRPQLLQITIMFTQLSIQNHKYLKSFDNSLNRSYKENGKVSNRIICYFSNTAHAI